MHTEKINQYIGENFAKDFGNLRYDKMAEIFEGLKEEIKRQSENDASLNHPKVSAGLNELAEILDMATVKTRQVWKNCEPHMKIEDTI